MSVDAPLLMLISFDGEITIVSDLDYDYGDDILLTLQEYSQLEVVERNFRIVLSSKGAEWTFYCPPNYKGIKNKCIRFKQYYSDGIEVIKKSIQLIGYDCAINIPAKYRRRFDLLCE